MIAPKKKYPVENMWSSEMATHEKAVGRLGDSCRALTLEVGQLRWVAGQEAPSPSWSKYLHIPARGCSPHGHQPSSMVGL